MTLQQFFEMLTANPMVLVFFFIALPLTAVLAGILGKNEGHLSPFKYLYTVLVYMACIPGIFAVVLSIYLFLFERQSIWDTDVYTQILPILIMIVTLSIIRRNVCFEDIPGFDKITGLMIMMTALMAFMWILDKTHIFVVSFMPFYAVLIIFVALLALMRIGIKRFL